MKTSDYQTLVEELGYKTIQSVERIQTLWGGYGALVRLYVDQDSIIIKHIQLPKPQLHPKGWNSDRSHQRKLHSYQVELNWYLGEANNSAAPLPKTLKADYIDDSLLLVLQDLKQIGFSEVVTKPNLIHLRACLCWLAEFHAQHIGCQGEGLWETGTYWHLDTRPDELEALADPVLKRYAGRIDQVLKHAPFQTLLHGDAKLANFCFTADGKLAAAVDFQYVGKGCAMKDVALFMSSAVEPQACGQMETWVLDEYFSHLHVALDKHQPSLCAQTIERAWRPLFAIAWSDFQRFVKGWSPGHWKINPYTEELTARAIEMIKAYR